VNIRDRGDHLGIKEMLDILLLWMMNYRWLGLLSVKLMLVWMLLCCLG